MCALPTLKASQDFKRIAKHGQKRVTPAFIMQINKTEASAGFRLGLTVSRKVGNAVTRNRAKRRLRELVRLMLQNAAEARQLQGYDIVLIGRTAAATQDFAAMARDLRWALKKLGVLA